MIENSIHTRTNEIMIKEGLNYRSFGAKLDYSDVVVSNIIKGRNKPSFDFIGTLQVMEK